MIHAAAADAVGEVWVGGERNGHCVLINRRQAVTCAHVLAPDGPRTNRQFTLDFKRLDLRTTTARVTAWRPYDPSLSRGSDLALLTFEEDAPDACWVAIEPRRPLTGQEVVAFEYQTARSDGDPREATVHYGEGSVISLAGHRFIDPGMSGTGLFLKDPGERLLGLVAWRPNVSGQTEAYAIPSDEILKLQADLASTSVTSTTLPIFDGLTECFLSEAGNKRPALEEFAIAARKVIEKPTEEWTDADINDLLGLHILIVSDETDGVPLPPGLASVLARLAELTSELTPDCANFTQSTPLPPEMAKELNDLKDGVEAFRTSPHCPDMAQQATDTLLRDIGCALFTETLYPRKLSHANALVQRAAGEGYRRIGRGMPYLLGRRADLLPPGTIFVDSLEAWAPEMVVIPEGRFLMGSPDDEEGRRDFDGPQHEVEISARFALARFALTFAEYEAFCDATERDVPKDEGWGKDRHPVINVSWEDAKDWCDWITEKTGAPWRLPSAAEWEYACRAGSRTRYSFGDEVTPRDAFYRDSDGAGTAPVDHPEFAPNGFGLWQMHGNI